MPLSSYLRDDLVDFAERAYWLYQYACATPGLPDSLKAEAQRAGRLWRDRSARLESGPQELLVQLSNAVAAISAASEGCAVNGMSSLGLWAALHRYRARSLTCPQEQLVAAAADSEPIGWRVDDKRNVLLLDLSGGLSVRLWHDLSFPRRMDLRKPGHAQTLAYDEDTRTFSTQDQQSVALATLVGLPSTHFYRTTAVSAVVGARVPIGRAGPVLPTVPGQSGTLF